jgi:hypothetical protein
VKKDEGKKEDKGSGEKKSATKDDKPRGKKPEVCS